MSNNIIVNATALRESGALSILKQFVEEIPEDEFKYVVFVCNNLNITFNQNNVELVSKDVQAMSNRFLWDAFGIKRWIKNKDITPVASISLQNTNFRTGYDIPNFIYYHQSLPFFKHKWNPIKSNERGLWFYKIVYPLFIKLFVNNKTEIFVQLDFIKKGFSKRFNFQKDKIHVVRPNINLPESSSISFEKLNSKKINLFYPATPLIYKNHSVLLQSILLLNTEIKNKIKLYLTCEEQELKNLLGEEINQIDIVFMGKIPYSKVLSMYLEADALVFPSYIETFGLPLIEAASLGCSIIAADLPYSREVLEGYLGVNYVKYNDPKSWSKQIELLNENKGQKHESLKLKNRSSWPEFFNIVKNKIHKNV